MLLHNLRIAWKSLRRNITLSILIVSGIALGIAVSTTFAAFRHAFSKDPIPQKSDVLRYVRLDSWDPLKPYPGDDPTRPPTQITFRDMQGIMKSTIPLRQSGMFVSNMYVYPDPKVGRPFRELTRLCFSDFFPMFDVPFRYGSGWDRKADAGPDPVVVLSSEMNQKLFGGKNSVGRTVRLADRDFRVVGVLAGWRPNVRFYDLTQNQIATPENIYIPFNFLRPMQIRTNGNTDGWGTSGAPGFEGFLQSETCWVQFWAELPNEKSAAAYRDFLTAYVLEQKKMGRFQRPLNNRLSTVSEMMADAGVVPKQATAMLIVSLLFLAVCAVNLVGLLLGKFLARGGEVGVRRALGASRADIFLQHIVECELIAVLGGLVGILLSLGALAGMNAWLKTTMARGDFFKLDLSMILLSVGLSLAAGFIAGVYPAWRTCRLAPAMHLKV
ncbi:MAG: ABC transporter permease [Acidobacteria bacterium]|nr:ABC transporter permease [Acidobacteriota bacterium]MCA1611394.1 ABC transporter permease [Acidobacteriota bacterium]